MKKFFCLFVLFFCVLVSALLIKENKKDVSVIKDIAQSSTVENKTEEKNKTEVNKKTASEKIYAVWLTYSEIGSLVKGKSEDEYREALKGLFQNISENKINTVFYQCRAFCDSFYESDIFPVSKYIDTAKAPLSFDPFMIFSEMAEEFGVFVHCWVNPYRISYDNELDNLPARSPVRKLFEKDKGTLLICESGIFLNPAHSDSQKLVFDGIREILDKYKVDGIHFDDYFYPQAEEINDKNLYEEYKKQGGILCVADWRRENVNSLISGVYTLVKSYDPSVIFSVSPCADIDKCKNVFYADVEKWCREEGFVDYIIPQIYYGFENSSMPFVEVVKEWERLGESGVVDLLCGLAVYKCGRIDENAGKGEKEWEENVNILSQQYEQLSQSLVWQGLSLFSYSYCFGENVTEISKKEIKSLLYMVE